MVLTEHRPGPGAFCAFSHSDNSLGWQSSLASHFAKLTQTAKSWSEEWKLLEHHPTLGT